MNDELNDLIMAWWGASAKLSEVKATESALRQQVIDKCFVSMDVGTNKLPLGSGYILKATKKLTYNIKKNEITNDYSHVNGVLDKLNNPQLVDEIVRWKPELSSTAYKKLTKDEQQLINTIVTISEATPSLEMVVPTGKAG